MALNQTKRPVAPSFSVVAALDEAAATGRPHRAMRRFLRHRLESMSLSRTVSAETSQAGGIKWIDLDPVENRYLLTGSADATIEAFDVLAGGLDAAPGAAGPAPLRPLFTVRRGAAAAHRYQVTAVCWYPVDTGLFVSGSADQQVKVWDANMLEVACSFSCPDKVAAIAMSGCASSHALVAVGTAKLPGVMLADVASGAFTHTLSGHRAGVWSLCWSPSDEHQLLSGDSSGEVRVWDVRRSGTQALLDATRTERPGAPRAAGARGGPAPGQGGGGRRRGGGELYASTPAGLAAAAAAAERSRGAGGGDSHAAKRARGAGAALGAQGRLELALEVEAATAAARPLAHEGGITGMLATADGLSLLTAGCDGRLRLWEAGDLRHQLVHYGATANRGAFPKRLDATPDGRCVFYPRGNDVQVFDVGSGRLLALLSQGHYEPVTSCAYCPGTFTLWTAGNDGSLLAWQPWRRPEPPRRRAGEEEPAGGMDRDWWMAAVSGRRVVRPPQPLQAGGGGAGGAARSVPDDVDAWSEEDEEGEPEWP